MMPSAQHRSVGESAPLKTPATPMADHPHHWTIALSATAIVVSLLSAGFSIRQSNIANETAAATIYDRTTAVIFELDKIHVANPELRPYFYDGKALRKDDPLAPRVYAMAEMTLDAFEVVLTQIRQNPSRYPSYASDRKWIVDAFRSSKVLREYLDAHRSWYAGEVLDLLKQAGPYRRDHTPAHRFPPGRVVLRDPFNRT